MNDQTLLKTFLNTQKNIQDEFLAQLKKYKAPLDTTELEEIVKDYTAAVDSASNLKLNIDTSELELTISQAVNNATNAVNLSKLTELVESQVIALNRNSLFLSSIKGSRLNLLVLFFTLFFGVVIGWGINWYFQIPEQLSGNYRLKFQVNNAKDYLKYLNSSCSTKQSYAKWSNISIDCNTQSLSLE